MRTIATAALLSVVFVFFAAEAQAANQYTSPVVVPSGGWCECLVVNVSGNSITVETQIFGTGSSVVETSGSVSIAAGETGGVSSTAHGTLRCAVLTSTGTANVRASMVSLDSNDVPVATSDAR